MSSKALRGPHFFMFISCLAAVMGCSRKHEGIMVWAWLQRSSDAPEHERNYALGMDALVTVCPGDRMHLEHERCCSMGMDTVVTVCTWKTNDMMEVDRARPV